MKIAIDISQSVYGTGVSVYTKNLVAQLVKRFPEDEYILFGGSLRRKKELVDIAKKLKGSPAIFGFPPKFLDFVWNSLHIMPIDSFVGSVDLVHTSDWTEPPSKYPKITTVHDMVPFKYPETTTNSIRITHKKKLSWVIKESAAIIAVSQATKEDLIDIFNVPKEKITVIYEGVRESCIPQEPTIIETIKMRYHIKGDYLFSVSTLEPRKNQAKLFEAFSQLKSRYPDLQLVVAGKSGWGEKAEPVPGVLLLGYVPDSDLPALYSGSVAYVLPSLYEGFSLTHLEAMACGTPVVGSNLSSMPEVIGEAGVLVDPSSVSSISAGIIQAVEQRGELIKLGLAQCRKFSWEKCADNTHLLYQQVLQK